MMQKLTMMKVCILIFRHSEYEAPSKLSSSLDKDGSNVRVWKPLELDGFLSL